MGVGGEGEARVIFWFVSECCLSMWAAGWYRLPWDCVAGLWDCMYVMFNRRFGVVRSYVGRRFL